MKNIFIFLCIVLFFSCQPKQVSETPVIAADTLAMQIDKYAEQEVTVEGKIVHVCPVDGSKMKLTSNRQIIKIIPSAPNGKFERHWNGNASAYAEKSMKSVSAVPTSTPFTGLAACCVTLTFLHAAIRLG